MKQKYYVAATVDHGEFTKADCVSVGMCTDREASKEAWNYAMEIYQGHEGLHGMRSEEEIMEECGDEDEAHQEYMEEIKSWTTYDWFTEEQYKALEDC